MAVPPILGAARLIGSLKNPHWLHAQQISLASGP